MNSLKSNYNMFLPSIIGENQKFLDQLIQDIDMHYNEWIEDKIDSKSGKPKTYLDGTVKQRTIRPSKKRLKTIQSKIKDRILCKIELPTNVHGGVKKRSNITNAKLHQGNKFMFLTDLKDFYPSIKSKKVHELFLQLGFNKQFAYYITKLTTWKGELPQGTPTSTHISNLYFLETDKALIELCKQNNITYTRYVDDLTFSSPHDFKSQIPVIISLIVKSGLKISYRKTYYGKSQNVTGIEVLPNKIKAPNKIIEKSALEIDNPPSCKPFTNYVENIKKTNKKTNKKSK